MKLQFVDGVPDDLERYGEVTRREGPSADLKVDRSNIAEVLGAILDQHAVESRGQPGPVFTGRVEAIYPV